MINNVTETHLPETLLFSERSIVKTLAQLKTDHWRNKSNTNYTTLYQSKQSRFSWTEKTKLKCQFLFSNSFVLSNQNVNNKNAYKIWLCIDISNDITLAVCFLRSWRLHILYNYPKRCSSSILSNPRCLGNFKWYLFVYHFNNHSFRDRMTFLLAGAWI